MSFKTKDFYGKDVAEAIKKACEEFGVAQENLTIEVLETGSKGIFGLIRQKAHIRAKMQAAEDEVLDPSPEIFEITLADGEHSVGELNEIIPLSQSALSQQLARLRREGLVKTRRESQVIHYSLCDGPADRVINVLHDIFCGTGTPHTTKEQH